MHFRRGCYGRVRTWVLALTLQCLVPLLPEAPLLRAQQEQRNVDATNVAIDHSDEKYELQIGDVLKVSSTTISELRHVNKGITILADGKLTLPLIGQVKAVGRTIPQLQLDIEQSYRKYYKTPDIKVKGLRIPKSATNSALGGER